MHSINEKLHIISIINSITSILTNDLMRFHCVKHLSKVYSYGIHVLSDEDALNKSEEVDALMEYFKNL